MNWLDITIILVLVVNIGMTWYRGFIQSIANIAALILAFVSAKLYHLNVYNHLIEEYDLYKRIQTNILDRFSSVDLSKAVDTSQVAYKNIIVDRFFQSETYKSLDSLGHDRVYEGFTGWLTENILVILSMVLIFIAVFIGVRIVASLLDNVFKLPILKSLNSLTGLLYGLIKGSFIAMILVLLAVVLDPVFPDMKLIEVLETSGVAIYFYKYNILVLVFEWLI